MFVWILLNFEWKIESFGVSLVFLDEKNVNCRVNSIFYVKNILLDEKREFFGQRKRDFLDGKGDFLERKEDFLNGKEDF